jgi:5'-AMP-activated protein kinase, regulatory gamma subunit
VLPLSFRLIELDISLSVKESLNILVQCGTNVLHLGGWELTDMFATGIVSAPLWDSNTSTYAGLLTVNDYLNVVRYYNLHADKLKDVDNLLLSDLRGTVTGIQTREVLTLAEVERVLNVKPPETISTSPETVLFEALRKQLSSRARRIPLVSYDSDTQRTLVTSVITQYRILKFIAMNVRDYSLLRKPLSMLRIGTYDAICRCGMESTVLDVIDEMVTRNISSVPVVTSDSKTHCLRLLFESKC